MTAEAQILATQAGSLQGYWKCDETSGTTLADSSGNIKDLTLTGSAGTDYDLNQSGQEGPAIEFHGIAGYASRGDSVLGSSPSQLTIFAIVKAPSGVNGQRIASFGLTTNDAPQIGIIRRTTGIGAFLRNDANGIEYSVQDPGVGTAFDSSYHSVALRYNGSDHSLWVDGVEVDTLVDASIGAITLNVTSIAALVRTGVGQHYDGFIQHVAVWSTGLTDQEILDIHDEAFPAAADEVAITSPTGIKGYQRDGSDEHSLTVSGTYSGSPTNIEYRWDGGTWATLEASPSGGTFSGTATLTKGQGVLDVRFSNDVSITDSTSTLTVGDVFVLAGQSNAEGRGTNAQSHTGTYTLLTFREDDAWRLNNSDPVDTGTSSGTYWPLLSTLLESAFDSPIIFISTAAGASGLVDPNDWEKGGSGSSRYENMISQISSSGVNSVKAVFFHQGEQDAFNAVSRADYNTALDGLASDIAADVAGSPPLIPAQIGMRASTPENSSPIRLAQSDAWDDNAGIYEGPTLHDVDLSDGAGDSVHFKTDAELRTCADRWFIAIANAIYGDFYGNAPKLISATKTSGTEIKLTFDRQLKTSGSLATAAWSIGGDGTPPSVSSVAFGSNKNELTVTADGSLTSNPTITFGDRNDASGQSVPVSVDVVLPDDRVIQLPTRPFVAETVSVSGGVADPLRGGLLV